VRVPGTARVHLLSCETIQDCPGMMSSVPSAKACNKNTSVFALKHIVRSVLYYCETIQVCLLVCNNLQVCPCTISRLFQTISNFLQHRNAASLTHICCFTCHELTPKIHDFVLSQVHRHLCKLVSLHSYDLSLFPLSLSNCILAHFPLVPKL
jgi:hypothetical protein